MKVALSNVTSGTNVSAINDNFTKIQDALNNGTLWRDNPVGEPNQMIGSTLDANQNDVINILNLSTKYLMVDGQIVVPSALVIPNALLKQNNLNDVANIAAARTNLGLGTAAVQNVTYFLQTANNLSDIANPSIARANIIAAKSGANSDIASLSGLTTPLSVSQGGTGASTTVGAITALGGMQAANNLSDVASVSTSRTNLGLGTAATQNTGTSGATVPLLNGANTWSAAQVIQSTATATGYVRSVTTTPTTGQIGELLTNTTNGVSVVSGTPVTITSVPVTAGVYEVQGTIAFLEGSGTAPTYLSSSISTANNTVGGFGTRTALNITFTSSVAPQDMLTPTTRITMASSGTIYLVAQATFSGGTMTANGFIRAVRV